MTIDPQEVVHRAAPDVTLKINPDQDITRCATCGQRIHRVPGGQGATWVHTASGAVAEANPPKTPPTSRVA